jgi:hypothetical protein
MGASSANDLYYLICDDRSILAFEFYTAKINLSENRDKKILLFKRNLFEDDTGKEL